MKIKYGPTVRGKRSITTCKNCNQDFEALDLKLRQGKDKFCCAECYNEFRSKNKLDEKERNIIYQKKTKYGLDKEAYNNLFLTQNNKCAICGNEFTDEKSTKAHVDHDHKTQQVRGLLCTKCNSILGFCNDNVEILENAIKYLIKSY